jgi:hexosaminidase
MSRRFAVPGVSILAAYMAVTIMAQVRADGVVTPLRARGYTVLPTPQQVDLDEGDVHVEASWTIALQDVKNDDISVDTLTRGLRDKTGMDLVVAGQGSKTIRLAVRPGTVDPKLDEPRAKQAYQLRISDGGVEVTGNTPQGLFYGVQTLVHLVKRDHLGRWLLPRCTLRDWPQYELRICHWDTKHHQDRIETLKRYLDWSAKFKINMICFELEDKFAYPSHPVIGQPAAFTPAQMQDLVDYGLARYIQIVPNIQAPAHMGYVLKHDEFKHLRSDGINYMAKFSIPETYDLIFDMYKDVIDATKGVDYLHVSTDEVYYAGIDPDDQKVRPYNPENRSQWFVDFVRKARDFAAKYNRRIFVWVEFPVLASHIEKLPPDIIDGIVGNEDYVAAEKKMGMRTLAYTSMQGAEWLFPNYFDWRDRKGEVQRGRLKDAYDTPISGRATRVHPIGTFAAAWDDSGLHNETFWLGWVTVNAYGWHPAGATIPQTVSEFFEIYYGPGCDGLVEAYRDLQSGARLYESSWDEVPSKERGPAYGSSQGKRRVNRTDETLRLPELPTLPDLKLDTENPVWKTRYAARVEAARAEAARNERLRFTLQSYLPRVRHNRYNIEVLVALAELQRHHIDMMIGMAEVEQDLLRASSVAERDKAQAVGLLVKAHGTVDRLAADLDATFAALKATWEKSMFPKNRTVDGKSYLHVMDDVKDHFADRRVDIDYMIAPEQRMDLPGYRAKLGQLIREYAKVQNLDAKALPDKVLED